MSKIFLSYRRDDSAAYAGRLCDRLAAHFGKDRIFMDIDHIEPGEDFVEVIRSSIAASSVLILLIGRQWTTLVDATGARRLDNPDDFVRLELSAAFDGKLRVIPVLVGGAAMPRAQDLPEPLRMLVRRQAFEISDTRFHADVDRLIEAIGKSLSAASPHAPAAGASASSPQRAAASRAGKPALPQNETEAPQRKTPKPQRTAPPPESKAPRPERTAPPPDSKTPRPERTAPPPDSKTPRRERAAAPLESNTRPFDSETPPSDSGAAVREPRSLLRDLASGEPSADRFTGRGLTSDFAVKWVPIAAGVIMAVFATAVIMLEQPGDSGTAPAVAQREPQAAPATSSGASAQINLRGQDTFPPKYAHSIALRNFARALNQSSSPVKLEVLPAGSVAPAFAVMEAVANGTLDAAWVSPTYFYGKDTAFALVDGPPFGPSAPKYVQWRRDRNVEALIESLYRAHGVKGLLCGVLGPYPDLWSAVPIRTPSDLAGRKVRAVGVRIDVFTKAGAAVNVLPAAEIAPAMKNRLIDAAHFVDPASGLATAGLDEVTKYLSYPGAVTPAAGLDLIVTAHTWDRLPGEAQAAVEQTCERNVRHMVDRNESEQQAAALSALGINGVRIEPLPAAVVGALRAAWQKVAADKRANPLFGKLLDSTRAYEGAP